ncbi:hypothetical protein FB451DRAFT_762703, partial [Mycena latifolia]
LPPPPATQSTPSSSRLTANNLPDEILSEILSPALKVSEHRFSDTSPSSPFATYSGSSSAALLVSKARLRVSTPLLNNIVVIRLKAQAGALAATLQGEQNLGRFIKKLQVEGRFGAHMHQILKSTLISPTFSSQRQSIRPIPPLD